MLSSKRDVDRHVQQLEAKISSESERNLKALSVAKLYMNVGDYETARRYLVRYLSVRDNSASAHKFLGQVYDHLRQRDRALDSYKKAYELDPNQKEAAAKVIEILVATAGEAHFDRAKARYWLEQGEKLFPRDKNVNQLREILTGNRLNGNNGNGGGSAGISADTSPEEIHGNNRHEESLLWSAGGGGVASVLNGSRREFASSSAANTPVRGGASILIDRDPNVSTPRRFVPRPSPERLAAQIEGLEATQERVTELLTAQNRQLIEEFKQHSMNIMDEMRTQRLSTLDEMKSQRQNVTDLKMEMKQGLHDIKVEVAKLGMIMKEAAGRQATSTPVKATMDPTYHREIRDALAHLPKQIAAALPPPPPPQQSAPSVGVQPDSSASKGLTLAEMQEALAQQTALLQMGGFGFAAGMMARPPIPPQPHLPPAAAVPPPPLPPQPIPQPQTWIPPQSTAAPAIPPQLPAASAPAPVIQNTPEPPKAPQQPVVASPKLHDYQINLPKVSPVEDPFKGQEGPAVPVVTTALLSNIPSPAYSSLAKTPPTNKTSAAAASKQTPPAPAPATGSLFDKFKPKAGSWECAGCMLRNEGDKIICPSCESVKPGHEEEAKKLREAEEAAKPKITFGAGGGFKFGVQPAAASTGSSSTTAKAKEEDKPSPFAGFSFGNQGPAAGGGGFGFAKPDAGSKSDSGDHLSFDGQGLKLNKAADAEPMAKTIAGFKNMKKLTFSGNTVGIEAAGVIGKALEKHPEFQEAHWKDMFTGRMKSEIPPALIHLGKGIMAAKAQLTVLDLSDNAFGPIGMEGIVDLLKSSSCYTLKELRLNNTGCGTTGGAKLARTLMTCYEKSKEAGKPLALKIFVLGRSRQENDGATELAKVFKVMGSLEEVVMPQNGIYHQGIKALSEAFCKNPNLRIINLNDNTFTPKGAKHFAEALSKLNKLVYLNLGDCLLKTEGCHYIAEALKGNGHQALEELHVDCNEIKIDGGRAIVDAIQTKPKMKVLNVDGNRFGDDGCEKLVALLGSKASLLPESQIEDDEGESSDEEEEEEEEEESVGEEDEAGEYDEEREDSDKVPSKPVQANIFGGAAASSTPTFSFTTSTSSSIFGGNKAGGGPSSSEAANTPVFGTPTQAASTSVFGTPSSTSIFGTPSGGSSIFGGAGAKNSGEGSAGLDLSANKNLSSFSALASKSGNDSGFAFGNANSSQSFSFAGAGTSLFKASPNKAEGADNADESGTHEDDGHDPHFEPIVPLPELVNVTTGEEEEEVLFKYRAKVYRYDKDTKQWKERGIGDMKILKHPSKNTFRVLLRREQIHKIACNHLITTEMELKPMMGSETSVSWFAMDYADEEPKLENLAVRFKLADTMNDFKKTFQECQEKLKQNVSSPGKSTSSDVPKDKDKKDPPPPPKDDKSPPKPSIFGSAGANTSGSIFGTASKGAESGSKGIDLSAGKSLSGFSDLAKGGEGSSGFAFGNNSSATFSFAGAGASIFKQSPAKKEEGGDKADESGAADEEHHDPHFEPIIPLPELVNVTTGEEEEEVLFKYRAKVYRYDVDTKQWKERGVGDMKILKHKAKNTFRVLLRRDQIHKIACNHLISTEMELKPMQTSETAVCWFAMDYADEEPKLEHLACKFKLADTLKDFKKVFEECQEKLKNNSQGDAKPTSTDGKTLPGGSKVETLTAKPVDGEDSQEDSDENGDEDDDEENTMYERECTLRELDKDSDAVSSDLGEVLLKIVYDDDVYGARIVAHSLKSDDGDMVCNHLIAMQTALEEGGVGGGCVWSALDFSHDPPAYRKFKAAFRNSDDEQEFRDTFYEGKELADQSEILELPPTADPESYYYGEGGDYEEEDKK